MPLTFYPSRSLCVSIWESTNVPSAVHVALVQFFVRALTPGSCTEKQRDLFISHSGCRHPRSRKSDCVIEMINKSPELDSFPLMSDWGNWCWRVGRKSRQRSSSSFPHFIIFIWNCFCYFFHFCVQLQVNVMRVEKENTLMTVMWWFVGVSGGSGGVQQGPVPL